MNSAALLTERVPSRPPWYIRGAFILSELVVVFSCFDLQSGSLQWRHDSKGEFQPDLAPLWYSHVSDSRGNLVIAHVGGEDDGALRAFDSKTGEVIWSWIGDGPGYASPVLVELEDVRQLVTQSQEEIVGVALSDGHQLWQIPFSTPWQQNIVTPVVHGDLLIFSGLEKGTIAIRLERRGDDWSTEEVWSRKDISMYMSSPVLIGDLLFGVSHYKKGQLFCLDPRSGEVLWKDEGRLGDYAALLLSEKLLFVLTTDGEFMVVEKTGEAFRKLTQYSVADSPTWAHPVILGSQLLVKDFSSLALWSFPVKPLGR